MGRRSLEAVRREEIVDATQACIVEYGLADTTLQKIADEAGMKRSAIAHFLGNRDAVIAAAVERSCAYYVAVIDELVAAGPPDEAIDRLIDGLVGGKRVAVEAMVLFDEILTLAHHDDGARAEIDRAYSRLRSALVTALGDRYPDAEAEDRRVVADALVHLIDNEERFRALQLSRSRPQGARTRRAARLLAATLAS